MFGFNKEAARIKVKKCEGHLPPEWRKFSVDPQITSLEVLYSILAKAFDLKTDFSISYRAIDPNNGQEVYLPVLTDYDLDAAFLRAHNLSITTSSEPCLNLKVDIKPFSEAPEWENSSNVSRETSPLNQFNQSISSGQRYVQNVQNRLPGLIMNQMEKTFSLVQRAFNLVEDPSISQPPRNPLSDTEFRGFLDSVGQIVHTKELRRVIYKGGIDPSLRRVVWKHILNVYPDGMTGRERMDYMKRKSSEYYRLRDKWKAAVQRGSVVGELAYVTGMVRKDVLRTDRLHTFYAGSDDNQNIASLFNILTTYALNHPAVSYCQGMSDIASPLLVTMKDEAHAYICFCAVMTRLRTNFMLDGIAMTTKFTHLSEALQFYDPEFYEYLKIQQADDLLFCYRWLLLEMKREFAFDDSLRMLEVLWSSLPSYPPAKELPLFEKEFEVPPNDIPPPKSPSAVILRTPRENPYTKICALRRQSSALSLYSLSNTTTTTTNNSTPSPCCYSGKKLDATKRMNQSLDETITSRSGKGSSTMIKSHQSLDESQMLMHLMRSEIDEETNNDDDKIVKPYSPPIKLNSVSKLNKPQITRPRSVSPIKVTTIENNANSIDNLNIDVIDKLNVIVAEMDLGGVGSTGSVGRKSHRGINQITNKSVFCSTGNLITKPVVGKKSGHFKDLKEKIVAGKKGIFASLDKIESFQMNSQSSEHKKNSSNEFEVNELQETPSNNNNHSQKYQSKGQKVVRNFNEFLNFAAINKSRISDRRLATTNNNTHKLTPEHSENKSKPLIKLIKSSFDDSDSSNYSEDPSNVVSRKPSSLQLQLNSMVEKQSSVDGSSPDDSQEYFPMTTSITRELRLELENLDRHVFGTDFHPTQFNNSLSGECETPESGDSVDKFQYSEITYTKLNPCDVGDSESKDDHISNIQEESAEIYSCPVITNGGVRSRAKPNSYDDQNNAFKRISTSSTNNDVFIWENPLHQFTPNPESAGDANPKITTIDIERIPHDKNINTATTPDEQLDLDYDGEIIEENNLGKKSVTPIRLLRKNGDSTNNSNRNSVAIMTVGDSDNSDSWSDRKPLISSPKTTTANAAQFLLSSLNAVPPGHQLMTNSCEEASEASQSVSQQQHHIDIPRIAGVLPPPQIFGCGNPFLMFLCLTILLQHRDFVLKSSMDYNEMAMHFDKMVRKHNVTRVLNQARRMYSEYLKSQQSQSRSGSTGSVLNNVVADFSVGMGGGDGSYLISCESMDQGIAGRRSSSITGSFPGGESDDINVKT